MFLLFFVNQTFIKKRFQDQQTPEGAEEASKGQETPEGAVPEVAATEDDSSES